MGNRGWIGVDFDGTLAHYDKWVSPTHTGEPIPEMVKTIKTWLAKGYTVKIFTARHCRPEYDYVIEDFCLEHIGQKLEVTNVKDFGMLALYDDRAIRIVENTGKPCCYR